MQQRGCTLPVPGSTCGRIVDPLVLCKVAIATVEPRSEVEYSIITDYYKEKVIFVIFKDFHSFGTNRALGCDECSGDPATFLIRTRRDLAIKRICFILESREGIRIFIPRQLPHPYFSRFWGYLTSIGHAAFSAFGRYKSAMAAFGRIIRIASKDRRLSAKLVPF